MLLAGFAVSIVDTRTRLPALLGALAALVGLVAWFFYVREGLVLSHYDAKAHLVVARRVLDSLTPSWQQVGAVWLPLPHLLNLLPVQVDLLYRTGASGSLMSIASFAVAAWAISSLVLAVTGSRAGAIASALVFIANPNLLYLQSTPMTEPLLLALTSLVLLWTWQWIQDDRDDVPQRLGWALVGAALTRYEGWLVVAGALTAAGWATWRSGVPAPVLIARLRRLVIWPAVAVALFLVNSRITVGAWFVSGGFFVPDPTYQGKAWDVLVALWWGTHQLSGYVLTATGLIAAAGLTWRALTRRQDAALLVPVAALAAGVLPLVAFFDGHPYRIRYMLPLVAAMALTGGIGVGWLRRFAPAGAVLLVGATLVESPPTWQSAPMLLEAQWDRPASVERRAVTACLAPAYRSEKVLASMGSLAHYMQELSHEGFAIADFIHEGNGRIWHLALDTGPAPHAGWMLVDERSEGGDVLFQRIQASPDFTAGMERVCEGGGVALYRRIRNPDVRTASSTH